MSKENIGDDDLENSVSSSLDENTRRTDPDDIYELNDRIDDLMQPPPVMLVNGQNGMPMTNVRMNQTKVVEDQASQALNASNVSQIPSSLSQKLFGH